MRTRYFIILILLSILSGCRKDDKPRTSGIDKIDNTLYGTGPYYANGFLFSLAKKVSTLDNPAPDIVVDVNTDGLVNHLSFQANNFKDSFYKVKDYPDAAAAIIAFNNLKTVGAFQWKGIAEPINDNQVWVYRTGSERFAKIRIISTVIEKKDPRSYGECTFEWLYQPDGSLTFPGK